MLKVTVDGIQVEVKHGATILDAAKKAGVPIPTFCHDDRLAPTGACRICLVEIEGGPPRLFAACVTPAADKMVVKSNSEKIARARKTNVELLLVHHPLDCPICPAAGKCGLQDLTYEFGLQTSRFRASRKAKQSDISNPCIEQNDNRCVLCSKCIRVCNEIQGVGAIGLVRRGFNAYVGTPFQNELNCDFCGHCVTTCPVGARNSRFMMNGRAWNVRAVSSVCSFCGTGCSILYDVRDPKNAVVNARAVSGGGVNGNFQCSKGWQGFQYVNSEERLGKPLLRAGGKLAPVQWEDALDAVAKKFKGIIDRHGPQAVAGIGSERLTNEENYLFQKFFRTVIGSHQVDNLVNLKNKAVGEGFSATLGESVNIAPLELLEKVPAIFLLGADTAAENPVVGNMIFRAVSKQGTKLIVANSRDIRAAGIASVSMLHRVGTETAVVNGILHEIFSKRLVSDDKIASRLENADELRKAVSSYTVEYVEKISGVSGSAISSAAEILAAEDGAAFLCGRDVADHAAGNPALEALRSLVLLTGNGDGQKGGLMLLREFCNSQGVNDMGVTPGHLPGYQSMKDPAVRAKFEEAWGKPLPPARDAMGDIIQQATEGKIKALYILGEDLMMRYPDGEKIRDALGNIEFIVCQDIFLTETTSYAHAVLPGVSFAEKTGTFTNMEGRVQQLTQQISPLDEALPDLTIMKKLAEQMGARIGSDIPEAVMEEIARVTPLYGDIRVGDGVRVNYVQPGIPVKGRAVVLPFTPPNHSTADFPFTLITGNLLHHLGPYSRKSVALNAVSPEGFAEINPADWKKLGVQEGDMLLVESNRGKLILPGRVSGRTPPGLIFIPGNFENAPVNRLISGAEDVTRVRITRQEG